MDNNERQSTFKRSTQFDERILIPGFAGHLLAKELTFIKAELRKSPSLRRQWEFRPSVKQLNEDYIRYIAMFGVPKDRKSVLASLRKREMKVAVH